MSDWIESVGVKLLEINEAFAQLLDENQQLKQRIAELEQALFHKNEVVKDMEQFKGDLAAYDIEQQEKGVNHIGAMLTGMGWCGVESLCKRAIEQLRKQQGVNDD